MRAKVTHVIFDAKCVPTRLTVQIDDRSAEIPLEEIWSALARCEVVSVDPSSIKRTVRVAVLDRDGRPTFATACPQKLGRVFVRTELGSSDTFLPHELIDRVFRPAQLPLLVGRWMRSVRDKMHPRLPRIPRMTPAEIEQ